MSSATNVKTTIINMALAHIKCDPITSPDDASERAVKANLFYDPARRAALRACRWRFAQRNQQLTVLGDVQTAAENPTIPSDQDILPGWAWTYKYPGDCVKVNEVYSPNYGDFPDVLTDPFRDQSLPIRMVKTVEFDAAVTPSTKSYAIGCNLDGAWAKFTFDETDTSRYDDMFIDAFSYFLAEKLCLPLTANAEMLNQIVEQRKAFMGEAMRLNGSEGVEKEMGQSRYLDVRT